MATTAPTATPTTTESKPALSRLATWRYVLNTANLPEGMTQPDAVSKWLVITRAAVFSMTVTSGLIGGLLAVGAERLAQIGGATAPVASSGSWPAWTASVSIVSSGSSSSGRIAADHRRV